MTSLEKILAYHNLKAFLDKEDWAALGTKLGIDSENMRRTWGKNVEDTFFLIVLTYQMVDHVIPFNEGFAKLSDTPSPDGIIILSDGSKLLVEVKATADQKWKISKARFEKQKSLAAKLCIDLYFATYIKNHWGLFTTAFVEANNYRINFPGDLKHSVFESIFNAFVIKIPKGLKITKHYSPHQQTNALVEFNEPGHGYLYKYEIQYKNVSIKLYKELTLIGVTAIENAIFSNITLERIDESITKVTHECPEDIVINDFDLVLAPINTTKSSVTNDYFDSSSFVIHTLDKLKSIGTLELVGLKEEILKFLANLKKDGIPIEVMKISQIEDLTYKF